MNGRPRRWTRPRRAVQGAVVLLFLALPVAAVVWEATAVTGTLASLRLGSIDLVEPSAAAAALLAVVAGGALFEVAAALLLAALPLVLLALLAGPVFCSWVCPFGLLSEGIDALRRRLSRHSLSRYLPRRWSRSPRRRRRWRPDAFLAWRRPRMLLLAAVLALGGLLAAPLAALLSAPRLLTALPVEVLVVGAVSPVTGGLLAALLLFELLGPRRLWCRALCPVGSTAKLLRTARTLTVRFDPESCTCPATPACQTRCAWGIDPRRMAVADGCTSCFACVEGCPGEALSASWAGSGPRLAAPDGTAGTARREAA